MPHVMCNPWKMTFILVPLYTSFDFVCTYWSPSLFWALMIFLVHATTSSTITYMSFSTFICVQKQCFIVCHLHFNFLLWNHWVDEQWVTGPKLQGCVACVKPGTEIRVNLAASIHEWRWILSWYENQGSRICMGCMENGWSVCVGWDCWEMTALLMEWSGVAFMKVRRQ
jgi:hypothetical protein